MSSLKDSISRHIRAHGPMSLAQYMSEALMHPTHGYYTNEQVFGAQGDFTTAPEISQIFGELVGLWAADLWQRAGAPSPFQLVEMGPGRGTLMVDALRATRVAPGFHEALHLGLIEAAPQLRLRQAERLAPTGTAPSWYDGLGDVPEKGPALILANEFFDALPIRQYVFETGKWMERRVTLDSQDRFAYTHAPGHPAESCLPAEPPREGDVLETCMSGISVMRAISERLLGTGGAALIVDYGYIVPAYGDTFQALLRHQYADPLAEPGRADLTAHVSFAHLARVARDLGLSVHGPVDQGAFLSALGIAERTRRLLAAATSEAQRDSITLGSRRLVDADQMGTLFKVMAITSAGWPTPAGFEGVQ
jgi:NADH dehydrogenase [ubiquinone] 1 alpha subcomplex assembly factor 7